MRKQWRYLKISVQIVPTFESSAYSISDKSMYVFALGGDIDGQTLVLLVDYTEFSGLVTSEMMEPRLLVFHDDQEIVQMFVVAENEALLELSSVSLVKVLCIKSPHTIYSMSPILIIVSLHCTSYKTYFWQGQMLTHVGL